MENIYVFKVFLDKNYNASDKKIDNDCVEYTMKELTWVKYDEIQNQCMKYIRKTTDGWTIDQMKMQKLILMESLMEIKTKNNIYTYDLINHIDIKAADVLYEYYNKKCLLSAADIAGLDEQVKSYLNPEQINRIKPPYNKMLIVLDMIKHFGSLNMSDIMSLSKKDLDTLYVLARLGFTGQKIQQPAARNAAQDEDDLIEKLKMQRNIVLDTLNEEYDA
jgi:hypothetical protein